MCGYNSQNPFFIWLICGIQYSKKDVILSFIQQNYQQHCWLAVFVIFYSLEPAPAKVRQNSESV